MNEANIVNIKNIIRLFVLVAFQVAVIGCTSTNESAITKSSDDTKRIAVIPKGTTHEFWKSVEAGASQAAEELSCEIIWKGPLKENDRAGQIQVVQQFISNHVDGVVLAPLDSKALLGPVKACGQANIPVVIIDSALDGQQGTDFVAFVATDNRHGGEMGGDELARMLGNQGKIVLLRYMAGSASTTNREAGFLAAVARHEGLEMISENRFAGATSGEAQTAALNLIDLLRTADGVFCPNESSTNGMLQALRKEGLAGKIKFVGFDASPPLVEALRSGEIHALVVQNPRKMGYLGVKTLISHLNHQLQPPPPLTDTGAVVVTQQNLDDPAIRQLLQ